MNYNHQPNQYGDGQSQPIAGYPQQYPPQHPGGYAPQAGSFPAQQGGTYAPHVVSYPPQYGGAPPQQAASYPPQDGVGYPMQPPAHPHGANIQYAPVSQQIGQMSGVVVRQKAQAGEALAQTIGLPYEASNKYRISALPPGKAAKKDPSDSNGWEPTSEELEQLDAFMFAHEESDGCIRAMLTYMGCKSLRPLKMHFSVANGSGDVYLIDRPFNMGGVFCCPGEMTIDATSNGQPLRIGRVREDFSPYFSRCIASCCLGTTYTDIERALPDGSYEKRYSLRTTLYCCGRVNNCCGATCLKNDAVYDILDNQGEIVAHLQRTYGGGSDGCKSYCRMAYSFDTYVLQFPIDSTPEDRMLLLTALFQIEYQLFELQPENPE